jgi:hypothetical protein
MFIDIREHLGSFAYRAALDRLYGLKNEDTSPSVVPNSFMGWVYAAFSIASLESRSKPSKLLLSALGLAHHLPSNIPHSIYISLDALTTSLSALTGFKDLVFEFNPPNLDLAGYTITANVLGLLAFSFTRFLFKSVSEHLDDLATRIYTPLFDRLFMTIVNELIFNAPHLSQFIAY